MVHVVVEGVALERDPVHDGAEVDLVVPDQCLDEVLVAVEERLDEQPVRTEVDSPSASMVYQDIRSMPVCACSYPLAQLRPESSARNTKLLAAPSVGLRITG